MATDSITNRESWRNSSAPGRTRGHQCFGSYFDERGGSCALGAVYDGVYHLPRDHGKLIPDHLERLFRCLDEVTKRVRPGCCKAAAAGIDDRAPQRRPSADTRADRRVAHTRKQRLELPMSFLDRFKPQPRWKHADPTVRAAAVAELMTDDPEQQRALVELAGTDEDVRVRRAAVARVDTVSDLVQLARGRTGRGAAARVDRSPGRHRDGAVGLGRRRRAGARRARRSETAVDRCEELAARYGAGRGARARTRRPKR